MQPQACVACDRPFAAAGNANSSNTGAGAAGDSSKAGCSGGNRAAAKPTGANGFPSETAYKNRGTFRPHTSQGRLGSPCKRGGDDVYSDVFSTDGCQPLNGASQTSMYAVPVFGETKSVYEGVEDEHNNGKLHQLEHTQQQQNQQKFVYRGGFKLPKYVRSSVSLADGLGSVTATITESGSYTGNSKNSNGFGNGSKQRPHTSSGGSSASKQQQQQQYGVAASSTFEPAFPSLYADDDASSVMSGVTMQHQQQQHQLQQQIRNQ
jgi:hypothetical protein